jgi:uncharacterized protein
VVSLEVVVTSLRRERYRVEHHAFTLDEGGVEHAGDRFLLAEPAEVEVELEGHEDGIRAQVHSHLQLQASCHRCLEPVPLDVELAYAESFVTPVQVEALGGLDAAGEEGSERQVVYEGDAIELDEGFWQNVVLALPMKCLCRPDCAGLCPRCGRNLNVGLCDCPREEGHPGLAGLADLAQRMAAQPASDRPPSPTTPISDRKGDL